MNNSQNIAIIQARMGSSRLPGKVLLEIGGEPMLVRVVDRTRRAESISQVIVATTTETEDDQIAMVCAERGYHCYRGSLFDVLDRYYQAAVQFNAQTIIRITSDCPLIDPDVIDRTVAAFFGKTQPADKVLSDPCSEILPQKTFGKSNCENAFDFAANRLPPPWGRTYPIGLDTEVCTFQALEEAWREAKEKHQREHVMPFFYDHLERYRLLLVNHDQDFGALRWTVDTPQDLELLRKIFDQFSGQAFFSWLDVLDLVRSEPALTKVNAQVAAKDYRQLDDRSC